MSQVPPSEFEGRGLFRSTVQGVAHAWEKLRLIYRTEQDPDTGSVDLDADRHYLEGGVTEDTDWRNIRG